MKQRRIVLVDDHTLFRHGMQGLLDRMPGYQVVAEAADGEEFLTLLPTLEADVVFMDISMPGMGGAETTERALAISPELKVITLSMFGDEYYYSQMVKAGAKGFLLKDSGIDEVQQAIEAVCEGGNYFCETLLKTLSTRMRTAENTSGEEALSRRETEILVAVCQGLSNQEIADTLFISKRTVDKHRANILEKTGCKNTASLVAYAIKRNLVDL
ncbi:MAG: response regulator transcription factor [Alistipes sp.]